MTVQRDFQLEKAKAYYYSWRLMDAYNILRRYFSRVPFSLETDHAEYVGIFVRILAELGKLRELKFYVPELERHHQNSPAPHVTYTLARVYISLPDLRPEAAKRLLEALVRNPVARSYHNRAKMLLAWIYDQTESDTASCKELIESIKTPEAGEMAHLHAIWRAKIQRDMGNRVAAEKILCQLLPGLQLPQDWYAYTSAKIVLIQLLLKSERLAEAMAELGEVRDLCEGRHFRSIDLQLQDLETLLRQASHSGVLIFESGKAGAVLRHDNYVWSLNEGRTIDRLLILFLEKRVLEKDHIIHHLYERTYSGSEDDKLVYGHVHSLRKELVRLGLSDAAIAREGRGYRLVPKIEVRKERI